jgi:putative flavoprotein involved in K+ transport
MRSGADITRVQTIVIGGGQAGLAVGYYLRKRSLPFLILDANQRVGDAWRNRWDSLRLFTPARYALPGLRFPARGDSFPTKDQVADYLSQYAQKFDLHVKNGVRVNRLVRRGNRFLIEAGSERFESENVVVAMANYQEPHTPDFARDLDPDIVQMHSHTYRNPSQLRPGNVLVVGLGNSGGDIAIDVARSHRTLVSGKETGHIPWAIDTYVARNLFMRLIRILGHYILSVKTPMGRKARPKMLHQATPLIRVKPKDLESAGIERVPRTVGVKDGLPLLADGCKLDVQNVIWCTGYQHGFPWIDLPIFDEDGGDPIHDEGIVKNVPGLYFVGLHFLYAMSSASFVGVGRDARRIADAVERRVRSGASRFSPDSLQPLRVIDGEGAEEMAGREPVSSRAS